MPESDGGRNIKKVTRPRHAADPSPRPKSIALCEEKNMRNLHLLLFTISVFAATVSQAAPAQPVPCSTSEYRQFDFWLGDWDVTNPAGKPAGHNHVIKEYGGCVLQ